MEEQPSILGDDHHNRADARMAARMISLGCVTPEKAALVLGASFALAAKAAKDGKAREYAAAMGVPLAAARLELERERLDMEKARDPQEINVNVTAVTVEGVVSARQKVEEWRQARFAELPPLGNNGQHGSDHGEPGTNGTVNGSP